MGRPRGSKDTVRRAPGSGGAIPYSRCSRPPADGRAPDDPTINLDTIKSGRYVWGKVATELFHQRHEEVAPCAHCGHVRLKPVGSPYGRCCADRAQRSLL